MNDTTRTDHGGLSDDDIIAVARSTEPHDFDRISPPAMVWENIAADLEVEIADAEAEARRRSGGWFRSTNLFAIAAATLLMVGVVAAVVVTADDDALDELASASMTDDGLPVASSVTAQASFVCDDDGECAVDIELSDLPDAGDADLELWVINGDVTDMHSLGLVTDSGRYRLPSGVTPDGFPIVDISIEPRDGDETHSGMSVLRGVFESA